jgi:hypothetical protein
MGGYSIMPDLEKPKKNIYTTKKCPFCYVYMPLGAIQCPACKRKVGKIDKLGFATKPVDWRAYLYSLLAIVAFIVFMWWAFLREP